MSFKLLEDRIAIIADEEDDTLDSGLVVVTDNARETLRYGTIAAVGPGYRSTITGECVPMGLQEGDRVFWSRASSGSAIAIDKTEYIFLSGREIVGVVVPE